MGYESKPLVVGGQPEVKAMLDQLRRSVNNTGDYFGRLDQARNTRFAVWEGQSPDARKHGKHAFPWDGASDTRIRVADEVINEQVMVLMQAFWRQNIQAVGGNSEGQMNSSIITQLMKWMIYAKMLPHLHRELELAAQWRQDPGMCVLSIEWEQETRVEMETLDIEGMAARAAEIGGQAGAELQALHEVLTDPLREEEALGLLRDMSGLVNRNNGRAILRDLREQGITERLPIPTILTNRPRWVALRPYVDVFCRYEMDDLQREPWICRVEYVDEDALRDRVKTQGYDEDFVEEALRHKGQFFQYGQWYRRYDVAPSVAGVVRQPIEDRRDQVELLHMYSRDAGEYGQPVLYYTVLNDAVSRNSQTQDVVGLHQPHGYDHGQLPFVVLAREHVGRRQADTRGVSEIARPWQEEIKVQRDTRSDYTQLATIPPLIIPPGRGGQDFPFGPGVQWSGRRGASPEFAPVPQMNPASIQMEEATRRDLDRYFGRMTELTPPALAQLHQQHMTNGWLLEMRIALQQTFQLMQQYITEEVVQAVSGVTDYAFKVTRDDLRGQYQFFLDFDVRELDSEFVKIKLQTIQNVIMPMDRFGVIDAAGLTQYAIRAIDPQLAAMVVRDPQAASENEIADEKQSLALIFSGQEAPMKLGNLNWGLRQQVLMSWIQSNPEVQQAIQQRPIFAQMLEQRAKYLQQQIDQQKNAVTGRTGGQPVLRDQAI